MQILYAYNQWYESMKVFLNENYSFQVFFISFGGWLRIYRHVLGL